MALKSIYKICNVILQFNRALAGFVSVISLIYISQEVGRIAFPSPADAFAQYRTWGSLIHPFTEMALAAITFVIFHFAIRLMGDVERNAGISVRSSAQIEKLARALFVLSPLRFIASFYIGGSVYGSLWSSVLGGSFIINRSDDLSTITRMVELSIQIYNLVNVFTIHIDPMTALFYALLLIGIDHYVKERNSLSEELSTVI